MTILAKLLISAAVFLGLATLGYAYRSSVYREGFASGQQELKEAIEKRNKEVERLNKQLVAKDQAVIQAKEEDREKIVTIYRTIREQVEPQIIEKPVFRDCRVGTGVLRSLTAAAEGRVSADPDQPAEGAPAQVAGAR